MEMLIMNKLITWQDDILKKFKFLLIFICFVIQPTLTLASERWILDTSLSTVEFELPVLFAKNVKGKFNSIEGFIELDVTEKNKDAFKQEVGLTITSMLSTELKMPILPFIDEGQDIYTIKTRFSDSSIKNLKLPESDFDIDIEIKAFNKKKIDSNNIEEQWLYAFQSNFKFYEPLSETIYFEDTLIGYEYKQFPKSYIKQANDFQIYLEVISYFYRDLALSFDAINNIKKIQKQSALLQKDDNNISSTGFNWASSSVLQDWYMTRSKLKYKDIKDMLVQTKEKINQCR